MIRQASQMRDNRFEQSKAVRLAMIAGQIRPNKVSDERVLDALHAVPRELFVPKMLRGVAYIDEDLEVAGGRFLMEPMVFARLLMEAEIKPDDAVLDIGCVTGYSTAVLSQLAEAVVAVEDDSDLVKKASATLSDLGCDNTAVIEAPLSHGAPNQGPFDVIVLNGAVEKIADELLDQLAEGGRLVCVRQHEGTSRGYLMVKAGGRVGGRDLFDAFTPVLPGYALEKQFSF
jgi:protein-L-isoaspartate(D-aspartate) O-methyltransferase